jgi:hypothetical protein
LKIFTSEKDEASKYLRILIEEEINDLYRPVALIVTVAKSRK